MYLDCSVLCLNKTIGHKLKLLTFSHPLYSKNDNDVVEDLVVGTGAHLVHL